MDLVREYRTRADECRVLAERALLDQHRRLMLSMADAWEILATQREAYLRQHPKESDPVELPWRKPN